MSIARTDFLDGMQSLEIAASRIGSPSIGSNASRSAEYLQLNGLHVVAFALLEDFLRRRVNEVLTSLGKAAIKFESFPHDLKLYLLQESFKGVNFYLSRKGDESRLDMLLLEALSLYTTADNTANFSPSDFCFGRSQSNISLAQITSFLQSFGVAVNDIFAKGMERLQLAHLGSAEALYIRLADNRHAAAHAFSLNFDVVKFLSDVKASYKVFAFLFDTALSQSALSIVKSKEKSSEYLIPKAEAIPFRSIRFDSIKKEWQVVRFVGDSEDVLAPIKEKELNAKLEKIKRGKHDKEDTVYVINFDGSLHTWLQPV